MFKTSAHAALFLLASGTALIAQESVYTDIDLEEKCQITEQSEEGGFIGFLCDALSGYPVRVAEDDLRQFTQFGDVAPEDLRSQTFAPWNRVNSVVEWRITDGRPYATILRWFIENLNPVTGSVDPAHLGQVLVISTVATSESGESCMVGMIDALANEEANLLARRVADALAQGFDCTSDEPRYHGARGLLSPKPPQGNRI
jgi:hypothetical protein